MIHIVSTFAKESAPSHSRTSPS
ncbi:unnamed protein product [Linum tenue]|uniref:Uncharacterized protein n=1 Tax=Linum tenue TaxID=586396 RepID=A0AAV0KRM1_9ROSI|nr:unnamed protein product [Linum tenue]